MSFEAAKQQSASACREAIEKMEPGTSWWEEKGQQTRTEMSMCQAGCERTFSLCRWFSSGAGCLESFCILGYFQTQWGNNASSNLVSSDS